MSGIYLHSPHLQCQKDCCPSTPCLNKGEQVIIRGSPIMACVHLTTLEYQQPSTSKLSPNTATTYKTPSKKAPASKPVTPSKPAAPAHTLDCTKKIPLLQCPFGRCEGKFESVFKHLKLNHGPIRLTLKSPLVYRLRNISRDMFVLYEPKNDVYFVCTIEESYQKYVDFAMQVIYNYKKKCCGHPKFLLSIQNVLSNRPIDVYKNKNSIGRINTIEILKDKLKKSDNLRLFYDMNIVVKVKE